MFTVDEIKRIKHSLLLLIKQSSDMEGIHGGSDDSSDSSDGSSDSSEEDFDMMTVTVLLLVNNNIAMVNLIAKAKHSQMINDGGSESRLQAWRKKAKGFILSPA
jgi:hypothetical protein